MSIYTKLTIKAQAAYVLTLSHRIDRQEHIKKELFAIGRTIPDSWLNFYYATSFPYNDIIMNAINMSNKGRFTKPNEYDCARNHYSIVKTAYDLGYKSVLIMEDDIMFNKDEEYVINTLNNIPDDYDILQFGGFTTDPKILNVLDMPGYWYKNTDIGIWNCSMYMLSRKGMEYYLAFMNKFLWVADGPLYKAPLNNKIINSYIATTPIVIQYDKNILSSDIRNVENDSIDYNNQNLYESKIDKSLYK